MMNKAVLIGTGAYVPERVVPNAWFNEQLGEDVDAWLRTNVEIYERRWCNEQQSTADLCEAAALQALNNAGITANDLTFIIVATDTPEFISPSTASVLQDRLKASNAGSFDLNTACAGFVAAYDTACKYIAADSQHKYILVVGAYAMSKYLNLKDKKTCTLFADGAGAVVLKSEPANAINGYSNGYQITQGQYHSWMGIYAGGSKIPLSQEVLNEGKQLLQFVHKFPKELNPQMWTEMAKLLTARAGISVQEVKQFVLTQINVHAIRETMDILGLPHDRAITNMHYYGYTGSAAIPMALHRAVQENRIQKGDWVMMIGSGGGLAFAGVLIQY
jgi:3-oxoacyl-[acyl-carrier-protein] synthase III